jgi:hypothetical protein
MTTEHILNAAPGSPITANEGRPTSQSLDRPENTHDGNPQHIADSMLEHALGYATLGYFVFPLWPVNKDGTCSCSSDSCTPGKHPLSWLVPNGHNAATTDAATIREWWGMWPDAGIGISLHASGLVVVGPDSHEWLVRFREWGLPATAFSRTGGGYGHEHYYYRRPDNCEGHRICKPGDYDLLSTGYAIVPPTLHASGRLYEIGQAITLVEELPFAPDWVVEIINAKCGRQQGFSQDDASCKTEFGARITELLNDESNLAALLRVLRINHSASPTSSPSIRCPLGCGDRRKSASLHRGDNGVVAVHTFHACKGDKQVWLLGEIYAGLMTGRFVHLRGPELASWSLKLARDSGVLGSIDRGAPELSCDLSFNAHTVFTAFREVLTLARALGLHDVPFSRGFAASWSGLTRDQVRHGWEQLRDRKLITRTQPAVGRREPSRWTIS